MINPPETAAGDFGRIFVEMRILFTKNRNDCPKLVNGV
jgi:hypothetical protein